MYMKLDSSESKMSYCYKYMTYHQLISQILPGNFLQDPYLSIYDIEFQIFCYMKNHYKSNFQFPLTTTNNLHLKAYTWGYYIYKYEHLLILSHIFQWSYLACNLRRHMTTNTQQFDTSCTYHRCDLHN